MGERTNGSTPSVGSSDQPTVVSPAVVLEAKSGACKRNRQESNDVVLAMLLQAGVPFEQADGYVARFVAEGVDCLETLQTLQERDLKRMSVKSQYCQRIVRFFVEQALAKG